MTFSSRAFGSKPVALTTQAGTVTTGPVAPCLTEQAQQCRDVDTSLCQSHPHRNESGRPANANPRDTPVERSSCDAQHNQAATVQMDAVIESSASSRKAFTADGIMNTPVSNHEPNRGDCASSNLKIVAPGGSATSDTTSTDDLPSSADESASQPDQDVSETRETEEEFSETHTPLEFQIPEDVLRAAMSAPENTKASFWSNNLYRGPENKQILVHYCRTKELAERVLQYFVKEKVVGFDVEWRPYAAFSSIKKNVSLIQLACEDRIALFHVALFSGTTAAQLVPPTLKLILESPEIYKVGVAVKGDFSRVTKFLGIEPQGVFELSRLHNLVQFSTTDPNKVTNKLVGLAAQVQQHLQLPLYKGGRLVDDPEDLYNVRSSDWSMPLNRQQIHYAAADAYAGFRLYDVLEEKRKQLNPTPPRPLVCDYDSKPVPRFSSNKPKKHKAATKTGETVNATSEATAVLAEQRGQSEESMEDGSQQTQEADGYETAQEEILNSHELEGEEPNSSEESYELTDESDDDVSTDSVQSLRNEETAVATDLMQRRVGRINLSRLKGPDPGYPSLPDLSFVEEVSVSPNEDLIGIVERPEEESVDQSSVAVHLSREDQETDEFDDSELENALQGLSIDSDGRLHEDANDVTAFEPATSSAHPVRATQPVLKPRKTELIEEQPAEDVGLAKSAPPPPTTSKSSEEEERPLIELLNDPEMIEYLHTPTQPNPSTPQPLPAEQSITPPHTPEYDLATTWAQTYLSTTIPSPTSRTPSHIRATIPHLRAYSMWRHQELSLSEIARQLRDPPLSESTVGSYVLQAIVLERMEFHRDEVRGLLMVMPEALRRGKWRALAEKVGA